MLNPRTKTAPGKRKITFKDFDIGFRRHPVKGSLIVKKDEDSIKQALKYLVLSNTYERPFSPAYGTDLRNKLFDLMDPLTSSDIEFAITTAVKNFEPRVSLQNNGFGQGVYVTDSPDENGITVKIVYTAITTGVTSSLDINLNRVR